MGCGKYRHMVTGLISPKLFCVAQLNNEDYSFAVGFGIEGRAGFFSKRGNNAIYTSG